MAICDLQSQFRELRGGVNDGVSEAIKGGKQDFKCNETGWYLPF